jgi:uncharacterized repeat protein (TIGR01451 family)
MMSRLPPPHRRFALAAALAAIALAPLGCSRYSVVAPPGSDVYVAPPVGSTDSSFAFPTLFGSPARGAPVAMQVGPKVSVQPTRVVAPVGSEVVLVASLCGRDGYMLNNERVDWMIAPQDAGQVLAVADSNGWSLFQSAADQPRKLTNQYAVSKTASNAYQLNRGGIDACNNLCIKEGQAWVAITSPVEGTSRVTAYTPEIESSQQARDTAVVHWVDAQVSFPITAINPVGARQLLTTTVVRSSNQQPLSGWTVRYQVVGGPSAGFGPDGDATVDVPTNAQGQASIEIFQPKPERGTSQIRIDVIRPMRADEAGQAAFVLQSGTVLATWSSADLQLQASGPALATVGATASYQMVVSNAGDLPAADATLEVTLPAGVAFVGALPAAAQDGRTLLWSLGQVAAREARTIQLDLRPEGEGAIDICGRVTAAHGLTARSCATTNIGVAAVGPVTPVDPAAPRPLPQPEVQPAQKPAVRLSLTGPNTAKVGEEVVYRMELTNPGTANIENVVITNTFDDGLEHIDSTAPAGAAPRTSPLSYRLGQLAGGATETITIRFRAKRAGTMCHTVEVSGDGVATVSERACLTTEREAPREHAALTVSKIAPTEKLKVGSKARFRIVVENTGNVALTDIVIEDNYDDVFLKPQMASPDGYQELDASDNDVVWKFAKLEPGAKLEVMVDCNCLAPVARACNNKVLVRTAERPPIVEDACVAIETAVGALPDDRRPMDAGSLSLSLADRSDPVVVGSEMTYEIVVTNERETADKNVALTVTFPAGLTPIEDMTEGPTAHTIAGQTVRFEAIREIRAGERLAVFRVRVRVDTAGNHVVKADLTSDSLPRPLTKAEDTTAYSDQ